MPDEDEDQVVNDDPANLRGLLRKAEKERERFRNEAAAGAEATRKLAIYEAGVTDPRTIRMLAKLHDGEWNAAALKETIADWGLESSTPPADGQEAPDPRQEAAKELSGVASGTRGVSDTRKPAVNDDEAFHEELLELMAEIPAKGKLVNKADYMQRLDGLMNKYQVQRT